ncbi:MAG: hypothetical protein ABIP78_04285 [Pyrinomonadaceae bacterium]
MTLPDIFQPYENLIEIEIIGAKHMVRENNSLLRCFQFLAMENILYGDFWWNGECLNCQVWLQNGDKEKAVMACRTTVSADMKNVRMAEGIDLADD